MICIKFFPELNNLCDLVIRRKLYLEMFYSIYVNYYNFL